MKKKGKSKKKPKSEGKKVDKEVISEVDKTFYELQIADLTKKLDRLTTLSIDLEQRNENLSAGNQKLDEDRADIIAYLKKTIQEQSDNIIDLVGRLESLKVTREAEIEEFNKQLLAKDEDAKKTHTELQSEIKLLEGKLNALEEFRLQRDELLRKFDDQEQKFNEQQKRHEEEVYNIERKFIVDKNTLVKHMEQKLMDLSQEFQNVTDLRIAESTQRLIRENIAVNNENIILVEEQKVLYTERDKMAERCRNYKLNMELANDENKLYLHKINVQLGIIHEVTRKYEDLRAELVACQKVALEIKQLQQSLDKSNETNETLRAEIKLLKGNLKDCRAQRKILLEQLEKSNCKASDLTKSLFETVFSIRRRLHQHTATEVEDDRYQVEVEVMGDRDAILKDIYESFLKAREAERECRNLEDWVRFYTTGCAGFISKIESKQQIIDQDEATQVGSSFEEFLRMDSPRKPRKKIRKQKALVCSDKSSSKSSGNSGNNGNTTIDSDFSDNVV